MQVFTGSSFSACAWRNQTVREEEEGCHQRISGDGQQPPPQNEKKRTGHRDCKVLRVKSQQEACKRRDDSVKAQGRKRYLAVQRTETTLESPLLDYPCDGAPA